MIDYEDLILARQEARDLADDADDFEEDCTRCQYLERCRMASEGEGEYPLCPFGEN